MQIIYRLWAVLLVGGIAGGAFAQTRISGKVVDALNNEPVISFFPVLIFSSSPKLNFRIRAPEQIATAAAGVDILRIHSSISLNASFTLFTNFGVDAKAWIEKINSNNITKIKLKIIFFIKPPIF